MSWATAYIEQLSRDETVTFRPRGNSMKGRIESGQKCTVAPLHNDPEPGDIVLCKVNGKQYLHLVKAKASSNRYQIGNNRGHINGWISRKNIFGKLIRVED
jgi:hypothetical protein